MIFKRIHDEATLLAYTSPRICEMINNWGSTDRLLPNQWYLKGSTMNLHLSIYAFLRIFEGVSDWRTLANLYSVNNIWNDPWRIGAGQLTLCWRYVKDWWLYKVNWLMPNHWYFIGFVAHLRWSIYALLWIYKNMNCWDVLATSSLAIKLQKFQWSY